MASTGQPGDFYLAAPPSPQFTHARPQTSAVGEVHIRT